MTHDVIIIGSGAGGAAAAYVLAHAGLDVLLIERGPVLPCDGSTLDVPIVAGEGRFLSKERWHDRHGRPIVPQERFNLGGKTKWYAAALLRFSPHSPYAIDPGHWHRACVRNAGRGTRSKRFSCGGGRACTRHREPLRCRWFGAASPEPGQSGINDLRLVHACRGQDER